MPRQLQLAALFLVASIGAAQISSPASVYQADPGAFVSILIEGTGETPLMVQGPEFLKVIGAPTLRSGQGLVNLLVDRLAPAGDHTLTITTQGETLIVTVRIMANYGVNLQAPEGETIVDGESVDYALLVTNTGNTAETVLLEVESHLAAELSQERLQLAAGEARTVTLTLRSLREGQRRDNAMITAKVVGADEANRFTTIETTILAFAGADSIEGPLLRYTLEAGTTYGSAGLGYQLRARMDGQLSDYVRSDTDLSFRARPGGSPTLVGHAAIMGERWRVSYRGARETHRVEGRYGDVSGYAALTPRSFGFGVSYSPSPLTVRFTHRSWQGNQQSITGSYRFLITPNLGLSPTVGVERRAGANGAHVAGVVGVTADLHTQSLSGAARVRLPLPLSGDWFVGASVSTRSQTPFGLQANASISDRGVHAFAAMSEQISEQVSLRQHLSHGSGVSNLHLGANYRHASLPINLAANVGAHLDGRSFGVSYGANVEYQPLPFGAYAYFGGTDLGEWAFGGVVEYQTNDWGTSLAYEHSPEIDRVSATLAGAYGAVTGLASYGYDFTSLQHQGNVALEYTAQSGHSLFANVAITDETSWEIGATFMLAGGFATPTGVVQTFGGRAVSFVTGVVFHDENRSGTLDPGEAPLGGVRVSAAGNSTTTDEEGRFRLAVPPGEHPILVSGHSANYAPRHESVVNAVLGETHELDVPLVTVASLIVRVFEDESRNGAPPAGTPPLLTGGVILQGPDGLMMHRFTDSRGEAVFQGLTPGTYTLTLDPESLPRFYEPTSEPISVNLEPGPTQRVDMGAAERAKEIVQTLRGGDLTLVARVEPMQAPPGADVLVTAQVDGEPQAVKASLPGGESVLLSLEGQSYRGRITVPADASGVLMVSVVAQRGDAQRSHSLPLIVTPGSLARLSANPTLPSPGETVKVEATLLTQVTSAEVILGGERYPLQVTADPYRFEGSVLAPMAPGSYELELLIDGKRVAETRFRVQ